jgi:hypothetical protein
MQVQEYLRQHLGSEHVDYVLENYPPSPGNVRRNSFLVVF